MLSRAVRPRFSFLPSSWIFEKLTFTFCDVSSFPAFPIRLVAAFGILLIFVMAELFLYEASSFTLTPPIVRVEY